jgi:hypothetical protein
MAELNFGSEAEWKDAHYNAHLEGETAKAEFESKYGIDFTAYMIKSQ